jgi:hypothetical protein
VSALKVKWWDVEHACEPPDIDEFSDQKARWQCSTCKAKWFHQAKKDRPWWSRWGWERVTKGSFIWRRREAKRQQAELAACK